MSLHKDMTGADLHEPKGVASATSGQVYEADGLGSGTWTTLVIPPGTFSVSTTQFTSSGTWTKPAGIFLAKVTVIGGGGNKYNGSTGTSGSTSSFGSHCSATGGAGGSVTNGGAGGSGSSGDTNLPGETGTYASTSSFADSFPLHPARNGGPFPAKGVGQSPLTSNSLSAISGGGAGGCAIKYILAASLGSTEAVTVGSAAQNNGFVIVEEYIAD